MWFFNRRLSRKSSLRRDTRVKTGSWIENLEDRALLSASAGSIATDAEVQVANAKDARSAVPRIAIIEGTYNINSSSGNTGTYAFDQNGLTVTVTTMTTRYTGTLDLHFRSERSKVAKGAGQLQFAGEDSPQPVAMKIKFKVVNGQLNFQYKYHTLNVS